jgi:hypothetical protein
MRLIFLVALVIAQIACSATSNNGRKVEPVKKPVEVKKAGATPKKVVQTKATPAKYPKDQSGKVAAGKKGAKVTDLSTNTATDVKKPAKKKVEVARNTKKKGESKSTAADATPAKTRSTVDTPIVSPKPVEAAKEQKSAAPVAEQPKQQPAPPAVQPKQQPVPQPAPIPGTKPKKIKHEPLEQSGDTPIDELIASPSEAKTAEPFDPKKHEEARKDFLTKQANENSSANFASITKYSASLLAISLFTIIL